MKTNCSIHERCIWELALEGAKLNAETAIHRMEKAESRLAWAEGMVERFADYMDLVPCQCNGSQAWNQLPAGHICERCELLASYAAGPEKETKE